MNTIYLIISTSKDNILPKSKTIPQISETCFAAFLNKEQAISECERLNKNCQYFYYDIKEYLFDGKLTSSLKVLHTYTNDYYDINKRKYSIDMVYSNTNHIEKMDNTTIREIPFYENILYVLIEYNKNNKIDINYISKDWKEIESIIKNRKDTNKKYYISAENIKQYDKKCCVVCSKYKDDIVGICKDLKSVDAKYKSKKYIKKIIQYD